MANNYFGFTHSGTQYTAQPSAAAYPAAQTAYVHQAAPAAAYATAAAAPRPAVAYEAYPTTPSTQYAYATRTPAATYDQTKAYYQPAVQTTYVADTNYQTSRPAYSTSTSYTSTARVQPAQKAAATTTYVYPTATTTAATYTAGTAYSAVTTNSSTYSGYDAALYSAATTYYQQQQAAKSGTTFYKKTGNTFVKKDKAKQPPKQPQLHYCDVCKISCAGPQTYREHLEGQKHKKKESAAKGGASAPPTGRGCQNQLRCELCDVSCTGADAYAAHIRGAKHCKVLKLHTKLGKPIPSTEPVVVSGGAAATTTASAGKAATNTATATAAKVTPAKTFSAAPVKKVFATPKITFVGGSQLKTTGAKTEEVKTVAEPVKPEVEKMDCVQETLNILGEKDVTPVGHEYIEEVKNEAGKTVSFNCKLCECKFNDPNAKEMHMKGRRHRLQYKKKVDPKLQVEVKPSIRARKIQEEKLKRQSQKEEYWRRRDLEERMMEEERFWEQRRYEEEMNWHGMGPRPFTMPMRRPDTSDDRHVMAKHTSIYPNEQELQAVQSIVSSCEKSLKLVSDFIAESEGSKPMETDSKKDVKKEIKKEEDKDGEKETPEENSPPRSLKGVMRVGVLAKGLLLHGNLNVHLVVLCSEKPTRTLLERVADLLPKQMDNASDEKYDIKICVEEAAIIVSCDKEPFTTCTITLTSPIMRETNIPEGETVSVKDPPDVLDRQQCLEALAALRHAKWFQARASRLQSCVYVIRILRDLCQRVPTWAPLSEWAMELLVEKCVSSGGLSMSPGDALRRVFECIASGILLPGGPGLYDPCEKDPTDAAASLTNQEREDITASAQHALRLIAFRQIHKVLGMDPLPAPRFQRRPFNPSRKRRRTNSAGEGPDNEAADGKKDKKEGEAGAGMETAE